MTEQEIPQEEVQSYEEEEEEEVKPKKKKKKKKQEKKEKKEKKETIQPNRPISYSGRRRVNSAPDAQSYHQPQMFYSQPPQMQPHMYQMQHQIYPMPWFQQGPSQRSRLDATGNLLKMTLQSKCMELNIPSGNTKIEYSIDEKIKITKLTVTATITENKDKLSQEVRAASNKH